MEGDIFGSTAVMDRQDTQEPEGRDAVMHALVMRKDEIVAQVLPAKIETEEQKVTATEAMVLCDRYIKLVDAKDEQFCAPLYRHWKMQKGEFSKLRTPVEKVRDGFKKLLSECRAREVAAQAAEQKKLNDAAAKKYERQVEKYQESGKGLPPLPGPVAPIVQPVGKRVETEAGETVWIDNYVPQITDEAKLPREYLMPDMEKLKAACKAGIEVPGVLRVNKPFPRTK